MLEDQKLTTEGHRGYQTPYNHHQTMHHQFILGKFGQTRVSHGAVYPTDTGSLHEKVILIKYLIWREQYNQYNG